MSPADVESRIESALEDLGLPRLITRDDIKQQYRRLALEYHPDISGNDDKMEALNRAYEVLMRYIDGFRYRFDSTEIAQQYPEGDHAQRFRF